MAKQTTVTVTDDLDGSANAKEVTFSLNGGSWTIDLSAKNRNALEEGAEAVYRQSDETGPPPFGTRLRGEARVRGPP